MYFVQYVGDGVLELNYMWLPTWLGMNVGFKKDLEKAFAGKVKGKTTEDLEALNDEVIDYIVTKYPLPGLRDYLDGIKFVNEG